MVEIKKYDIKKLEEAKNIVDSNGMLIYKLKSDFEVKLNEVKSQESFFVQSFELLVEKAGATVLDRINKANSDNNTMLGKVVNNIKIANEE